MASSFIDLILDQHIRFGEASFVENSDGGLSGSFSVSDDPLDSSFSELRGVLAQLYDAREDSLFRQLIDQYISTPLNGALVNRDDGLGTIVITTNNLGRAFALVPEVNDIDPLNGVNRNATGVVSLDLDKFREGKDRLGNTSKSHC
jgi:hypothetical protein